MDIRFHIDPERLTLGDRIALEEAESMKWSELRDLLANHMVNEAGAFIDPKESGKILVKLTLAQLNTVLDAFRGAIEEAGAAMIPPAAGGS